MSEISTGTVNEIISKMNKIFEDYNISEFQQVSIFEVMKFDMYLKNIKKRMENHNQGAEIDLSVVDGKHNRTGRRQARGSVIHQYSGCEI